MLHKRWMNMKKKGELSLSVVVIAAICLVVLVVLSVIFASRMGLFNKGMKHCDTTCVSNAKECENNGYEIALFYGKCQDDTGNEIKENAYCCSEEKATPTT